MKTEQDAVTREERALTRISSPVMANFSPLLPFQKHGKVISAYVFNCNFPKAETVKLQRILSHNSKCLEKQMKCSVSWGGKKMEFWIVCLVYWLHSNKEDCQPDFSLWFSFMWDPVITIRVFPHSHGTEDLRNSESVLLHYNVVAADTRNLISPHLCRHPKTGWGSHLTTVTVCTSVPVCTDCVYSTDLCI